MLRLKNFFYLFKSALNAGFLLEIFNNRKTAGENIDAMKVLQGLREQAMAKVTVSEGVGIGE